MPRNTWAKLKAYLESLPSSLGLATSPPRAVLVVSAHWQAEVPTVQTSPLPPLLFDYYGFPPQMYQLKWPAPGAPDVAARVRSLLSAAGLPSAEDGARGFDHGVFVPLLVSFPAADVPCLQLSLVAGNDPAAHLQLGEALAPLRDEGVLIVASGFSFHNMGSLRAALFSGGDPSSQPGSGAVTASSERFHTWLRDALTAGAGGGGGHTAEARRALLAGWMGAPGARACHPAGGEEHLSPLLVAAGAAGCGPAVEAYSELLAGVVRVAGYEWRDAGGGN